MRCAARSRRARHGPDPVPAIVGHETCRASRGLGPRRVRRTGSTPSTTRTTSSAGGRRSRPGRPSSARPTSAGSIECSAASMSTNDSPAWRRPSLGQPTRAPLTVVQRRALGLAHHVEVDLAEVAIVAVRDRLGHRHRRRPQPVDDAVLAPHVVRLREQLPLWWAPDHQLTSAGVGEEVRQVGVAAGQPLPGERADDVGDGRAASVRSPPASKPTTPDSVIPPACHRRPQPTTRPECIVPGNRSATHHDRDQERVASGRRRT